MSPSTNLSVFIIGITGYIGGAVAIALKKKYPSYNYTAFVRSARSVAAVQKLGFTVVLGPGTTEGNIQTIADASLDADIVINAADADDLPLTKAILGVLERSTKKLPVLIHTSGSGVVSTKPTGSFEDPRVWDDNNVEDIKDIGPNQPHRQIDLAILNAGKNKHFIGYIIAPTAIYGVAPENPGKKISYQVPELIRVAVRKRQTVYGGNGTNRWNNVHIYDTADLFIHVFEKSISERRSGSFASDPYERFYWASVGSHLWGDIARLLAPILYEKGLVDSKEAISADPREVFNSVLTNSLTVANRGLSEGWTPKQPSLEDALREEVEGTLAAFGN